MTQEEFKQEIGKFRMQKQKLINDTYLWVSLAVNALDTISESDSDLKRTKFHVPSTVKGKTVIRKPEDLKRILKTAKDKDLYQSTFIFTVAQFEGFLSDIIALCLKYDQRKLKMNVLGGQNNKKIDISEVLDCKNQESIINLIINKQLGDLFYAGPKVQREYIENVLSVKLEDNQWLDWFEFKATRDLLVHNSGIINSIYLEKVGDQARGKQNGQITIDKKYFEASLSKIKSMIGKIDIGIRKTLK
jgi:hypothetical protein